MTALLDRLIESLPEDLRNPLALSLAEELSRGKLVPSWEFRKAPSANACGRRVRF